MRKTRILIADDHAMFREGLRTLLAAHDDMEVVGEAEDGLEAVEKAALLQPDIVLMDIAMPRLGGLEATLELRHRKIPARVLVLTQYDDKEYAFHMIKAGASGYVVKKAAAAELVSAIRAVRAGESFLYPSVTRAFIDRYVRPKGQEDASDLGQLSDREKQVLKLLAEGRSNREIADLLCLSVKTVMSHRAAIMERLDIHNRTDLVKFAIRAGLVQVER